MSHYKPQYEINLLKGHNIPYPIVIYSIHSPLQPKEKKIEF
ncbi:Protein of unknown function [Bacillus mycoides]|uniref:Uncharacterized protein n=1 Tax=Bacillus mycoides TaxID=1405 RepID=A0A1C4G7U3_BACMY|nr:Protein of unknown function [Bacillus mycoides]SCC64269.1 Protein of unknown function [Bacillus mycoides]